MNSSVAAEAGGGGVKTEVRSRAAVKNSADRDLKGRAKKAGVGVDFAVDFVVGFVKRVSPLMSA